MPNGSKCHAPALTGKPYCYFHTRLHTMAAAPTPAPGDPLKLPILEDRSAIQIAIAQVFDALGSSQLDPRRAGLFLYGLQIASQNVERQVDILSVAAVHSITQTPDGDELGPVVRTCPFPCDCSTCDVSDGCEKCDLDQDEDEEEEDEADEDEENEADEEEEDEEEDEAAPVSAFPASVD
jgi:hypothetical protein